MPSRRPRRAIAKYLLGAGAVVLVFMRSAASIIGSAQGLLDMLGDILDFVRFEAGSGSIRKQLWTCVTERPSPKGEGIIETVI